MSEQLAVSELKHTDVQTDLTVSSGEELSSETPGQGDMDCPKDRTIDRTNMQQDSSSSLDVSVAEKEPFDKPQWREFKQLVTEFQLSAEQEKKWLAFETSRAQKTAEAKRQQIASWATQTRAQYGAGLEQEIAFALRAANTFGGPELRALLEETGLGNHPVVIRTLSGIGRTISEDVCPGGLSSAPQDKTFAEALYGKRN
ncbi:MAG: hypothetical protein IKP96_00195 [Elusimicrobiaceae bacterium]|nr:hypothetical protein [Elusimicrobiaceae bacterium]